MFAVNIHCQFAMFTTPFWNTSMYCQQNNCGISTSPFPPLQQLGWLTLHHTGLTPANLEAVAGALKTQWQQLNEASTQLENEITGMTKRMDAAKIKSGPCESSVEPVLQKHGIQRQSYHGGAFVGNHVHKALKEEVIRELTSAPVAVIASRCPPLQQNASTIQERYKTLMSLYASCSALFSVSTPVNDDDLTTLDGRIKTFMATARREIVYHRRGNVTPKLHLLEDHLVPCMRRFHVGLGLLGEQGGEGIHHEMNLLGATFSSMPNVRDRLKTVVSNHCVATLPQHIQHIPVPAKRHRK